MDKSKTLPYAALSALAVALSFSLTSGSFAASVCIWVTINVLLASSFRFVQLIGELNFAVAGFFGLGAYASGYMTTALGYPFVVSLVIGAFVAGLFGLVASYVTLRAKGPYFMLISFALTEVLGLVYTQIPAIGGNSGMVGIFPPELLSNHYVSFVVTAVIVSLWLLFAVERSGFGKILVAIRNNDSVVQSVGINVHWTKVVCVTISAVLAGAGGALLAHANNVISPGDFSFLIAVYALAAVKVGGESRLSGAVLGAVVLTLLAQVALSFGPYEHIFYGAAIVLALLTMPNGLVGVAHSVKARLMSQTPPSNTTAGSQHGQ